MEAAVSITMTITDILMHSFHSKGIGKESGSLSSVVHTSHVESVGVVLVDGKRISSTQAPSSTHSELEIAPPGRSAAL